MHNPKKIDELLKKINENLKTTAKSLKELKALQTQMLAKALERKEKKEILIIKKKLK